MNKFINRSNLIYLALVLFLIANLIFSYRQYSLTPLDGDFSAVVMPGVGHGYARVLNDPIGWAALNGESYAVPNRFTAHYTMSMYFKYVPLALQQIMSPIESLYASVALMKLLVHVLLLSLISYFISAWQGFQWKTFLIALVLISPFFHAGGNFVEYMAVVDPTITYVMFYALPMVFILFYFMPLYRFFVTQNTPSLGYVYLVWLPMSFLIVFFGALPAPIILISAFVIIYAYSKKYLFKRNVFFTFNRLFFLFGSNKSMFFVFLFTVLWSIYSFYIGTYNSENNWWPMPLNERYALLPKGIYEVFFNPNNGVFYLLMAAVVNGVVLYFLAKHKCHSFFKFVFYLILFSLIYMTLLPMGGYREYRPYILRRDTLLPVLFILFFIWGVSSLYLLSHLNHWKKIMYIGFITTVSCYFLKKDKLPSYTNVEEKKAMLQVANSKDSCVVLDKNCTVMGWNYNFNCEDSKNNCKLLEHYNILTEGKRYCFKEE